MRLDSASNLPPWPVAPRPFMDECMGSWIGRIAAYYKLSVEQLNADYDLRLDLTATLVGWLMLPPIGSAALRHLAEIARINVQRLQEIQTPAHWVSNCHSCCYCEKCLFLNPVDVSAPFWQRQWLRPNFASCHVHSGRLETMGASMVRGCDNFDSILKIASKKAQSRRNRQRFNPR
jgi:hypothetical protein